MNDHRADLHYHGPIGFEPYWLKVQGYGGKNLLKLITDTCFKRDLTICALTSETDQVDENGLIPRNSIHDRIGYLIENYLQNLNKTPGYQADKFGPNSIIIEHNNRTLCLISGQTPIIMERNRRYDHLVIGSNQVPNSTEANFRNFRDTIKYCNDNGLLHGFEHPELETHFGIGLEKAKEYLDLCDFVEHNAQLTLPRTLSRLPILGRYTRLNNDRAKEFAKKHKKPYIATSDGHMIESAGRAYIEIKKDKLDLKEEQRMLQTLRGIIKANSFTTYEGYEPLINFFEWTIKFKLGLRKDKYKKS